MTFIRLYCFSGPEVSNSVGVSGPHLLFMNDKVL